MGQSVPSYGDRATCQLDDGTAETSFGLTAGGYLGVANSFAVTGGNNTLTSLEVTWGSPVFAGQNGIVAGTPFDIFVWADTVPGAGPQPGTLLYAAIGGGAIDSGAIDSNGFQSVALPNIVVPGGGFIIAVAYAHAQGAFPFCVDSSGGGGPGRSWFIGAAGFNPNTAPGFGGGPGLEMFGPFGVNAMVRANAIPAPGAAALLGLGGLVALRRRR